MALQYWVGDYYIDLSRNQITYKKQPQTLAPKALAVLTYLAENQGKVVSHDALLDHVWQGTSVSPNTLQRSIAQLRKALGDDGKSYIKTHAKQGYSLECNVKWQPSAEQSAPLKASPTPPTKPSKPTFGYIATLIGGIALILLGYQALKPKQTSTLSFGELRLLTATDNKELGGIYSPDGQYVVFQRYSEEYCVNHIWAKDINTQKEFQLTKNLEMYGSHSFSQDGNKLVFIQSRDCAQPITQKECYTLMLLDFHDALKAPQSPSALLECKNSRIKSPLWLNNNDIALLQEESNRWQLIKYSIRDNKSLLIYEVKDGNLINYDYSTKDDLIALTSVHSDGHYYIETLKPSGQLVSSYRIKYPKEIAKFKLIRPSFSPLDNRLIFSTGRQLFTLSYEGQITNISLPLDESIGSPKFHPDDQRMLVIKGHYDSDIVSIPLAYLVPTESEELPNTNNKDHQVLERSIFAEKNAIFQPNSDLIAFISNRSGESQIWLTSGKDLRQLSRFPMDTYLYELAWSNDGKSLLVNADQTLIQIFLDGTEKRFSLDQPIHQLFQWDSESQTTLAVVQIKGILKFAEINLASLEISIINNKKIHWAAKTKDDQMIYMDQLNRFWKSGPAEDILIDKLNEQGTNKRFRLKDNLIYGINDDFQFWSYSLANDTFKIIRNAPRNIDYLTDINRDQLLMTIRASAKKEVAELHLK
ncbi:winged helix-turn-helix domain-containing protein [Kangiella sp. TOML190]|uniref:winged helix-turn-helix domain-containing protein n=1 Tax=Kangiella sp. TOML190 TaxID=2931351 RepID=UPI00203E9AF3|nr:winged helix-turn-helix domain-containing protein [Kangiella sp. TOML190]